jgi:hypothetical protein
LSIQSAIFEKVKLDSNRRFGISAIPLPPFVFTRPAQRKEASAEVVANWWDGAGNEFYSSAVFPVQ